MKLSIIMPVYNEEATLEEIIRQVMAVDLDKELIIVDDGSTDGTIAILKEKIECIIDKYAAAVINTICPHYYTQLVDRIAEAQEGIAEARRTKDVTTHKYGTQIEKYREELGGLEDVLRLLKRREGDFAKEKRRAFIRLYAVPFIVGVAVALVGVGLTMWIGDSRNASTESPPFHAQPGPPAPGSTPPPGPPPTP